MSFDFKMPRIGLVGGGQLARMFVLRARAMGFSTTILDPDPHAPASPIADAQIVGSVHNREALYELAENCDVISYELEHIDSDTLCTLAEQGHAIIPHPKVLQCIQDKAVQKQTLSEHDLPVPKMHVVDTPTAEAFQSFGYPLVQKARTGGYDGRGVIVLHGPEDFPKALQTPSLLEECVSIDKELAIMIARSPKGEIACYPVVEMVFDPQANICDSVLAPARIDATQAQHATQLAVKAIEAIEGFGLFGVEMFLTATREILINEIAPRPHNSGHYTMEACVTDQFEQHLRAICNLPLGQTTLLSPAVMVNLLGAPEHTGTPQLQGLSQVLEIPGLALHLYGKAQTRPLRKMGHVTILAKTPEQALKLAEQAQKTMRILASEPSGVQS
ncbi:MAG: 5-(carboxyamino)imidazole ribonucleotide synthase [Myxococcota bacterium]